MAKLTLNNISSRYASVAALNDNFDLIETALENTLSRDGTSPNTMSANLDMNSKNILNVGTVNAASLVINGQIVSSSNISYTGVTKETQTATSGQTVFTLTQVQYSPLTNNLSVYIDGVYQNPSTYTQTSSSVVTFSSGVHVGAVVDFVVFALNDLGGTGDAANITYTSAGVGAQTTTVQAKLRETVSVKDFGAVGDGVTDDTAAIQAALDVGGNIVFPTATYYMAGQVTVNSNTVIDFLGSQINTDYSSILFYIAGSSGARKENVVFKNGILTATVVGSTGQMAIQAIWADNVSVQNCVFNDFGGVMVKFNGGNYNCEVANCTSNNSGLIGFYAEADGTVSPIELCDNIRFIGNTVSGGDYGIEAKQATNVNITNNYVIGTGQGAGKPAILVTRAYSTGAETVCRGVVIANNIVDSCDGYGIQVTGSADVVVQGNTVKNCINTGLAISGSHFTVADNVVSVITGAGSGIAVGYSDVTTGSGGITDAGYDKAYATVTGNSINNVANISVSIDDLDYSTFSDNSISYQNNATYAVRIQNSAGAVIHHNTVYGGTYTYGYRLETTSTGCSMFDNSATGFSAAILSIPANHPGYFLQNAGDITEFVPCVQTTDATPTTLYSKSLDTNTLVSVEATVVCRNASYRAFYKLMGCVYRASGSATIQGSITVVASAENDAGLDATIVVSGNDLVVQVTGIAASTINWNGRVQITQVA